MTFWQALKASYRGGTAFLIACPLLAMIPVVFEVIQHVVEVRIGMYDSVAMAEAVENHPARLGFGFFKVLALMAPIYGVSRFLVARDAAYAGRLDPRALGLFAGFVALQAAFSALTLFVLPRTGAILGATFVVQLLLAPLLAAWVVAAANGNPAIGPLRSIALTARHLPFGVALSLAVMMPVMVLHYVLAVPAMIGPKPLMWPALIVDSFVVGWLGALIAAGYYYVADRAAPVAASEARA